MKKNLITAILMTIATTILLGIIYPLVITGLAQLFFKDKANGQTDCTQRRGDRIAHHRAAIYDRQVFSFPALRAGTGYDAANSGGTNLGPTNQKLIDRINADAKSLHDENPAQLIPVDLLTTSASGLDPDISPAAAEFQVPRVARERGVTESALRDLVQKHTYQRELGLLGEPRVNVLELNLALDELAPKP